MAQPMRIGIWEKPIHIAFLSGGAMLPRNSLNFGLANISPMLKQTADATISPTWFDRPKQQRAAVRKRVTTIMLVVARMRALRPAKKKQVSIIIPALIFTIPSG